MKKLTGLGLILLLFTACQPEPMTPLEYVSWVRNAETGLKVIRTVGDLSFEMLYTPHEYIALRQFDSPFEVTEEGVAEKVKTVKNHQYVEFSIASTSGQDLLKYQIDSEQKYYERTDYFNFFIKENLFLVQGNDTLPCLLFHQEQMPTAGQGKRFMLSFAQTEIGTSEGCKLIYQDQTLGAGPIQLNLPAQRFNSIPSILF